MSPRRLVWLLVAALLPFLFGCNDNMKDQARYEPLEKNEFFKNSQASRPLIEGTVARGQLHEDDAFYKGKVDGKHVQTSPLHTNRELLDRGRERFNIFCAVCHDQVGTGNGMVVQRGFTRPPSLHEARFESAPDGYLFDVITNGFGSMPDFKAEIKVEDRWAIVAYLRALRLSQNANLTDAPKEKQTYLTELLS